MEQVSESTGQGPRGSGDSRPSSAEAGQAVVVTWLGQAGFHVDGGPGRRVLIDPYLSDAVESAYGIGRRVPVPVDTEQLDVDLVLCSHHHEDHCDPDTLRVLARHPSVPHFAGPPTTCKVARGAGFETERVHWLTHGNEIQVGGLTIEGVVARHEVLADPTPDATGFLVTSGSWRIYHSGDTQHDERTVQQTRARVDLCLVCINGTGGNMSIPEAALLVSQQGPGTAIPMHYGMWSDEDYGQGATLDPHEFRRQVRRLAPDIDVIIPTLGEPLHFSQPDRTTTAPTIADKASRKDVP